MKLPALATAHSHAFQRGMRGAAQRPGPNSARDDFWTWRGQMYRLATSLTPESIDRISRVAFRELHAAGVRTVGEFHYIQHQADGTPYAQRTLLSDIVIEAARASGLRVCLLRVAYHRAGPGRDAELGQKRFCDPDVDHVLADVDELRVKYKYASDVRIGVAPHSVRAVPPSWIAPLAAYATKHALPFHMHVAEVAREVDECVAETKRRPVELLADLGVLSSRFCGVHCTNLLAHEAKLLGAARAFACICATTERDLGDGLPDLGALRSAGARLCTGIDSHVITDPIDDLRALETQERLRTRSRVTFSPSATGVPGARAVTTPAEQLWREGSLEGANACGFPDTGGDIEIDRASPTLALVPDDLLLDAVVFAGNPALVAPCARGGKEGS